MEYIERETANKMNENVVKALRVCTSERTISKCSKICPYHNVQDCRTKLMIDAADAIEKLSREIDTDNAAMTAMDVAMPRWISVAERLPEKNGKYLCYVKRFGQYAGMQYYYVDVLVFQEDRFFEDGIGTERVTHWMPLPQPPKEKT